MREFLKGLELDQETIDTIMAEHGKLVTNLKEQIDEYKEGLSAYEEKLGEYQSMLEEKDRTLENLQDVANENKDLKAQLEMSGSNVKKEFSKFVTSEVMANVNDETDFATALENFKSENPQYFGETVVKKVQSSPNLNGGTQETTTNDIMNDILRGAKD